MTVQRHAEKQAREQRSDERGCAEHQQYIGDRGQAERQNEADETAGQQDGACDQCKSRVAHVDQHATALPEE